ncbi:MAG: hypothetical protein BGO31_11155 [Bacteroidetes bacterium 43-16]|uniref:hypothetical protein n=1 Tax=uncultured Dysgonomonas sp. TaxID=206096 RepID=UPI000929720C|nr:hypothetical protein [uncultured Dysgonomonas sp.]OJV51017.1 MAG: hypothetical protein BGO31_11155 [Bacteroidetes bacterium 43-16]
MFSNITWLQFLVVLIGVLVLYYIIYFIRFRFNGMLDKLNKKSEAYELDIFEGRETDEETRKLDELEIIINGIKTDILDKAGKSATKEQLLAALPEKVADYDGLHQPAYRYALNNYIIQQTKQLCGVEIEEEELEELWDNLPR